MHIFLSGSEGTCKSHLGKVSQKHCFTIVRTPINQKFFLLGPTGISAVNIDEITIHSGSGIKPGAKLV